MKDFVSRIEENDFPITFEVPSPRGGNVEEYLESIKNYDFLDIVSALNVCNNPVGKVRIDPAPYAGRILEDIGVEPIAHLTCRDSTLSGLQRWLLGANSLGLKTLLAMTGDYAMGDYPAEEKVDHINSLELITGIKEYLNEGKLMPELSAGPSRTRNRYLTDIENIEKPTNFQVGGVALPERTGERNYAARKVEAGADFFQTQICYDAIKILDFIEGLEERIDNPPPVLVGTTPFSSSKDMMRLSKSVPQVNIPSDVRKRLSKADDFSQESLEFTVEFYEMIIDGVQDRGLETTVGAHIIPVRYEGKSGEVIKRLSEI
ncbi:MAG: methylenetetrahydrofolate reductase [Candidatus Thermoplasmatota archaeon]|nr:methylenetetrahydrofolate reductase [Candidatus Thermoplasmatota archaeon]